MYQVQMTWEGIADLLFNRMTEADLSGIRGGNSSGDKTDAQRQAAAWDKVYADSEGLYMPAWTVKKVILEGAHTAGIKLNRKPLRQRLAATLFVQGIGGRFVNEKGKPVKKADYLSEVVGRIPPGPRGKTTIVRRPALRLGWRLIATAAVLDDGVPEKSIQQAIEAAGPYVGIGAWRPEFGRFHLLDFTVKET